MEKNYASSQHATRVTQNNPDSGFWKLYPKSDGFYQLDSSGNEIKIVSAVSANTNNYIPKSNGSIFVDSQLTDNGSSIVIGTKITLDGLDTGNYPISILSARVDLTRMQLINQGATQTDLEISINGGANSIYYGVSATNNAFIDNRTGGNLLFQNTGTTQMTFDSSGNVGMGESNPTAKLQILKNTVGTGQKGLSVNFATIGEVFYIDDNGAAVYNANTGFTIKGGNGSLSIISNGGVNPSLAFKYNNGASDSGILFGNGASMFMNTPALGLGGATNFNPTARLHIQGVDSTSTNYAFKVENLSSSPILYTKNDGEIGMNGFTIRQLSSATYFKTSGTNGYIFNNFSDSTNLGKISNTGQILFGDLTDANYSGIGIGVKSLSLTSNVNKEGLAVFFKNNTDQDGVYFSSKQGVAYIQPYSVNAVNQNLILGGRNSGSGTLENLVLKSNGGINVSTLQVGNAGLSSGDLYVDTASNILANGDFIVGRKV